MAKKDWKCYKPKDTTSGITCRSKKDFRDFIFIKKSNYPIKNQFAVVFDTKKSLGNTQYFDTKKDAIKYADKYMKKYKD